MNNQSSHSDVAKSWTIFKSIRNTLLTFRETSSQPFQEANSFRSALKIFEQKIPPTNYRLRVWHWEVIWVAQWLVFWALFLSIKTNLLTCLKQEVQVPVKQEKTISLFLFVTHHGSCLPEQRSLGQFFRWPILAAVPWRKRLCIHWDLARFWSKHWSKQL